MNQQIYIGYGTYKKLSDILHKHSPNNIFLVTGDRSYEYSGAERLLSKIINKYNYIRFYDFEQNPKLEDIKRGTDLFNKSRCDFIVAVGGGSVIDTAKSISVLACHEGPAEDYIKNGSKLSNKKIITAILPTTAGTGSESTHFSVVYIEKTKYSFAHSSMLPNYAILDPTFTETLPKYITACTGMDALCQGIESFWSVNSTEESRDFSRQSIQMVMKDLIKVVNDPDKNSRENILVASNLAGRAINIAQTTAAHAISYPITSFFNIPHGHAVALTLPYLIEFNYYISQENLQDRRGVEFVRNIMKELLDILAVNTAEEAKDKIITIMKMINLETSLTRLGIDEKGIEIIIKNGFNPQRIRNNPKIITEKELRTMLRDIQ
jgi:alcohol dehydrogenase class IV